MKKGKLATALAISTIALLSGCGSSGSNNPAVPGSNIIGYTTQCTASGCVQVPIYGTGGCVPLSQPIYFGGSGATIAYPGMIGAGTIPYGGQYGTLSVSASPISVAAGQTVTSVSAGSQLTLSLTSGGGYGYSSGSNASVSGSLQLSPAIQQQIAYYNQGIGSYSGQTGYAPFMGQPGYYGQQSQVCVSGIALQGYLYQTLPAFTGTAFLYLNNTQHGWALPMN
jgi:hypothetical protein